MAQRERDPVEIASRALEHRDRSRHELDQRLARAGVEEAARADALDTLERVGYVDDARFAVAKASSLAARGFGDWGIRHDLKGHLLDSEVIEQALASLDPELERARALVERYGSSPKTAARLARKGFGQDALESVFRDPTGG